MAAVKANDGLLVDAADHVRLVIPRREHQQKKTDEMKRCCVVIIFTGVMMKMGSSSNMLWLLFVSCSNVQGDSQTSICITIEPGLLLKGDILVRMAQ